MPEELQHKEWSGKTDGQPWMQRSLIAMFRVMPLGLLYGVMALVVPFYMLFNRKGYRAMFQFFHKRFGHNRWKSFWNVYKNHFRFGQVVLDRFGAYAGKKFWFEVEGQEYFDALEANPKGFMQLSSHVGNYEMAGYTLVSKTKKLYALAFAGETETVMENRQRIFSEHNMKMISVRNDLSHLFALNAALENGDIVSILADRIFGSQKNVECDFLGAKAKFPLGAFAMAVQKEVQVLAVFVMKESVKQYRVIIRKVECDATVNRREQMVQLAQSFASQIEDVIRRFPTQWFNYFDFWQQ